MTNYSDESPIIYLRQLLDKMNKLLEFREQEENLGKRGEITKELNVLMVTIDLKIKEMHNSF